MNKFISIGTFILIVLSLSCASTKRQVKTDLSLDDLYQKIENRDFTLVIESSYCFGESGAVHRIERSMRIKGDSLITDIGAPSNFISPNRLHYPVLPEKKRSDKEFVFTISDYKVSKDNKNRIELLFSYEFWNSDEMKLVSRSYKLKVRNSKKIEMYEVGYEYSSNEKIIIL